MSRSDPAGAPPARLTLPVGARDHLRGSASAPLTLLEYGDFECPQCERAFGILGEVQRRFGDRLRFVFRNFPLTSSHPHAQHAAEAAEWAAAHGAFWQMHDALYADPRALADGQILDRARTLGLPARSLEAAWANHTYIPRVKEDFQSGLASGVTGTPAFFINGVRHQGLWDADSLTIALDSAARRPPG
jgi:protein-disulfide isomerase